MVPPVLRCQHHLHGDPDWIPAFSLAFASALTIASGRPSLARPGTARRPAEGRRRRNRHAGGEAEPLKLDVTSRADVAAFVKQAQDRFGRLDVLVSNAGLMPLSPLDELRVDEWDRMIDVNIRGVLHGIAAALPVFRAAGSGHFINVSSVSGLFVAPTTAVYSATKFAVRAISEGLRQEAGSKIRVTTICPGAVETNLAETISNPELKNHHTAFATVI